MPHALVPLPVRCSPAPCSGAPLRSAAARQLRIRSAPAPSSIEQSWQGLSSWDKRQPLRFGYSIKDRVQIFIPSRSGISLGRIYVYLYPQFPFHICRLVYPSKQPRQLTEVLFGTQAGRDQLLFNLEVGKPEEAGLQGRGPGKPLILRSCLFNQGEVHIFYSLQSLDLLFDLYGCFSFHSFRSGICFVLAYCFSKSISHSHRYKLMVFITLLLFNFPGTTCRK